MSAPSTALARELIRMACTAPSVHNTQPWTWRLSEDACTIELLADRTRQLPGTDRSGRDLAISCGAALHHLEIAARAFGLETRTTLLPERGDHELLARTVLSPGTTTEHAVDLLAALENRETDRRGFSDWEIPVSRLEGLAEFASGSGVRVVVLTDPADVRRTEQLIEQARLVQLGQPSVARELDDWTGRPGFDGIPPAVAEPPGATGRPPDRFSRRRSPTSSQTSSRSGSRGPARHPEATMVICTGTDSLMAWLRTGWALSALWIRATLDGLGLTPQSQVIEVAGTRRELRRDVLDDLGRPQLVVRVGWQESTRPYLARTPRRDLQSVLLP